MNKRLLLQYFDLTINDLIKWRKKYKTERDPVSRLNSIPESFAGIYLMGKFDILFPYFCCCWS